MSDSKPDTDTSQVDELHGELRKLIKSNGLKKAIIRLRSLNSPKSDTKEIDTYEHIVRAVIQVYGVTEKQLYEDVGKYVATDPRRTIYVLLNKYLNYTQKNIGLQFGKTREAVNFSIMEFRRMIKDDSKAPPIIAFRKKHEAVEDIVLKHVNKVLESKNPNQEKKLVVVKKKK